MKVRKDAWSALAEMEPDVCDVERWGMVLRSIGTADEVPTEAAFVIGAALIEMAPASGASSRQLWQLRKTKGLLDAPNPRMARLSPDTMGAR